MLNQIQHIYCTNRALVSIPTWAIPLFLSLAMYMVTHMPRVHTGYPSGMVPGARPGLLPLDPDGRNNSITCRPRHYVRSTDRQIAPSGVIDPLRTSPLPRDSSRLARIRVMHACIAPSAVGPGRRTAKHAGCYTPSGGGVLLGTGAPGS